MQRIHFIAVGGAIMHQLALALQRQGHTITGSDDEINDPARSNLTAAGIIPEKDGWFPEKITTDLDAVILGMHAKGDNPELLKAKELGIPVYSFPQYMYEVSKDKKRVVIAGSHGKTTTTSMVMHILKYQGLDFDYMVGAKVAGFDSSVKLSDAPIIVMEGDEYPASVEEKRPKIFFYHPHISVLTGVAWDHINVFPTYENYCSQFETYLQGMESGSHLFYNGDDSEAERIVKGSASHLQAVPYHMPKFHYDRGEAIIDTEDGQVKVAVFGSHNFLNMQAAIGVCTQLGVSKADCYKALASFTGAARRLEKIKESENIVAFRDFAHAPSKLKATLKAVREAYPNHTLLALFELHTYSSLSENFLTEYAGSMDPSDEAVVYFSHHAIELKRLPELHADTVKSYFKRDDLQVIDNKDSLEATAKAMLAGAQKPICLLLMSSGTFDGIEWDSLIENI